MSTTDNPVSGEGTELVERLREGVLYAEHEGWNIEGADDLMVEAAARIDALEAGLAALVNAKALSGVREVVAGWNGEGREDGPYERHPTNLGATLPKTNCGAVYALDEAMQAALSLLQPKGKADV